MLLAQRESILLAPRLHLGTGPGALLYTIHTHVALCFLAFHNPRTHLEALLLAVLIVRHTHENPVETLLRDTTLTHSPNRKMGADFSSTTWIEWAGPYSYMFHHWLFLAPPLLAKRPTEGMYAGKVVTFSCPTAPKAVVLLCHDSNTDVDYLSESLHQLARACSVIVVAWEYPGYGHLRRERVNPALDYKAQAVIPVTCADMKAEALRVFDATLSQYPQHPLILMGQGFGTGFAMHMAGERAAKVNGMVLYSAFTSLSDVTRLWFKWPRTLGLAWWYLEPNLLDNVASALKMGAFKGPIRLIHGKKDRTFPLEQAYALENVMQSVLGDKEQVKVLCRPKWDHFVPWKQVCEEEVVGCVLKMLETLSFASTS